MSVAIVERPDTSLFVKSMLGICGCSMDIYATIAWNFFGKASIRRFCVIGGVGFPKTEARSMITTNKLGNIFRRNPGFDIPNI